MKVTTCFLHWNPLSRNIIHDSIKRVQALRAEYDQAIKPESVPNKST